VRSVLATLVGALTASHALPACSPAQLWSTPEQCPDGLDSFFVHDLLCKGTRRGDPGFCGFKTPEVSTDRKPTLNIFAASAR
jgi:hypothetical protein